MRRLSSGCYCICVYIVWCCR